MRRVLIGLNVVAPGVFALLWIGGQFWAGLGILFLAHMLALWATLVPTCSWWGAVTYRLQSDHVWLTIDDGPDPEDTPWILEVLEAHGAKASFFVIGEKVRRWPGLVEAIRAAGHRVENHTMTHPQFSFWRFGLRGTTAQISLAQEEITAAAGEPPRCFRAPAGFRNLFVHPVLRRLGLRLVAWSARGRDGVSTDREAIVKRLEKGITPGAILLMHEGKRDAEGRSLIRDTLPKILAEVESRGLRVRVPEEEQL